MSYISVRIKTSLMLGLSMLLAASCSKDEVEPELIINPIEDETIAPEANSRITVTFTSALEWQASCTDSWASVLPASGEGGTHTLTVTAHENVATDTRSTNLELTSGSLQKSVTLIQEAAREFITLEQTEYTIPAEGKVVSILFYTNMERDKFSIQRTAGWLTEGRDTETRAAAHYEFSVNVEKNPDTQPRFAELRFIRKADSSVLTIITFTQKGMEVYEDSHLKAAKSLV